MHVYNTILNINVTHIEDMYLGNSVSNGQRYYLRLNNTILNIYLMLLKILYVMIIALFHHKIYKKMSKNSQNMFNNLIRVQLHVRSFL